MDLASQLSHFRMLDGVAVALLVLAWLVIGRLTEHPPAGRPSVTVLMIQYRRDWMRQFVTRQPRIFDATIVDSLRQGTAFFASATMIAIGGGLALIGNTERLLGLAQDLALDAPPSVVWEMKILTALLFVTNAFLNFVWAHRLFGYCSIVMASVPNDPADPSAMHRAMQAAEINISAAKNFNRGLRSVYFAIGSLAWLLGPVALLVATAVTFYVIGQREFASHSRRVLMRP